MPNAHVLYTRQFTPEYVGELRDEKARYRLRARLVEGVAVRLAVENEALRLRLDPALFARLTTENVFIGPDGAIVGAREAVRRAMIESIPDRG